MVTRVFVLGMVLALGSTAGCDGDGGDPGPDPGGPDANEASADPDGGSPSPPDAGAATEMARLYGAITRSAEPENGADGDIYIALFDRDPVLDADGAELVAQALVEDADLSGPDASVAYEVLDIPPRADDYFLVAFLDDNDSVDPEDPAAAGPDKGDLLSLRGLASPTVEIPTTGDHEHDIDLNSVLPF